MHDPQDEDPEDLLTTIEQVEETLSVMTSVVSHLREQLSDRLEGAEEYEMSAEEYLETVENPSGVWH